jgi:hypothetical protein
MGRLDCIIHLYNASYESYEDELRFAWLRVHATRVAFNLH